jgi:HEAT repeat protein
MEDQATPIELSTRALRALPGLGEHAREFEEDMLAIASKSPDEDLREAAIRALIGIGGWRTRDFLVRAIESPELDWHCSDTVLEGISRLTPEAARVVPVLCSRILDRKGGLNYEVLEALGAYGAAARNAAPELLVLLDSPEDLDRAAVIEALSMIDPAVSLPRVLAMVESPKEEGAEYCAMEILFSMDVDAESVVPTLKRQLRRAANADFACLALASFGSKAQSAVPDVIDAILEERACPLDGALALGLLLEGTGEEPPLLDHLERYYVLDPEELEWIETVRAAIRGDAAAAERIRSSLHMYF